VKRTLVKQKIANSDFLTLKNHYKANGLLGSGLMGSVLFRRIFHIVIFEFCY